MIQKNAVIVYFLCMLMFMSWLVFDHFSEPSKQKKLIIDLDSIVVQETRQMESFSIMLHDLDSLSKQYKKELQIK